MTTPDYYTQGCGWTTGSEENIVRCGRPTTYSCDNAPDTCEQHKSSCCFPKLLTGLSYKTWTATNWFYSNPTQASSVRKELQALARKGLVESKKQSGHVFWRRKSQ